MKEISITPNKYISGSISIGEKTKENVSCEINDSYQVYKVLEILHERIDNENFDEVNLKIEIDQNWIISNKILDIYGIKCDSGIEKDLDIFQEC